MEALLSPSIVPAVQLYKVQEPAEKAGTNVPIGHGTQVVDELKSVSLVPIGHPKREQFPLDCAGTNSPPPVQAIHAVSGLESSSVVPAEQLAQTRSVVAVKGMTCV